MRIRVLIVVLLLTLPAGCAASADTAASPAEDPNVAACSAFLEVFSEIAQANADRAADRITVDEWYAIVDDAALDYSAVALMSEGDLKTRVEDLVALIDEQESGVRSLNGLSDDFDLYLSHLNRIGQVCNALGVPMTFSAG